MTSTKTSAKIISCLYLCIWVCVSSELVDIFRSSQVYYFWMKNN